MKEVGKVREAGNGTLLEVLAVLHRIEEREKANAEDLSRLREAIGLLDSVPALDDEPMFRVIKGSSQRGSR